MNIYNSGKIPERSERRRSRLKKRALTILLSAVLSVLFAGCSPSEPVSTESASLAYTSYDGESHIPTDESSIDGPSGTESFESSELSSDVGVSSDSSDSSSDISEASGIESAVSSAQSEALSDISSQTHPESSSPSSAASETSEPPPNVPVIIPDIAMPTSPGTECAVSDKGAVDYSNASQGYVSAKYTGNASKLKLRISCGEMHDDYDLTPGKTEYFPLVFGNGEYTVTIYENTSGTRYSKAVEGKFTVSLSSSLSPFLYPNRYSVYNSGSGCVYKAAEVCAGKTEDIEKIAAIFMWVTSNVTYDHGLAATVQKGYTPDPERTYNSRTGICFDYASLMCAMLRSQSIPTRLVIGNAAPSVWHAWNEVYTNETGWITPELMLKNAGYNIVDSTFYASAGDKAQIASYISNSSNYQAVHYY